MKVNRRDFLATSVGAALLQTPTNAQLPSPNAISALPDYEKPLFQLHQHFSNPVKIASIELLRNGNNYFVRSVSTDGAIGIAPTKQVEDFIPILLRRVIPFFIGKDARDLESLIDGVYIQNYKMAEQAFWCPVAYVEQSLLDLLGKQARKPVGELLGGVLRRKIPVYLSGSGRDTTAEEEVEVYVRAVEATGTKAVKFKIGGRMSRNADATPGRTERMMQLARKRLGDQVTLYADANGSYNAKKGIEVGKFLESLNVAFFEEPCPWEELGETKRVADALTIPIAAGEQDASLWRFQWMIENRVIDIVQCDLNYNGGLIRAARVARMARQANMTIVPHNTQTGITGAYILQFASCIPNTGKRMEYPWRKPENKPSWYSPHFEIKQGVIDVPTGPGLGVEIDPDFLNKATRVQAC